MHTNPHTHTHLHTIHTDPHTHTNARGHIHTNEHTDTLAHGSERAAGPQHKPVRRSCQWVDTFARTKNIDRFSLTTEKDFAYNDLNELLQDPLFG